MAILSDEQMRFLAIHSISMSRVFDASGMKRSVYQAAMRELSMTIAIGVSPCNAGGHTMKTRSGHCPQCGTHNLAFLLRHDEDGYVYVADSKQSGIVKIGTAGDVRTRITTLNNWGYGGVSDWRVHYHIACAKAGKVEFKAQSLLQSYRISRTYLKGGNTVDCQELFACSASMATESVQKAVDQIMPSKRLAELSKAKVAGVAKPEAVRQPNQKIAIQIKGPVYIRELAQLMGIKAHHVVQDLLKMKIHLLLDQEVSRQTAEKICKKRGFVLKT
ncbi:MAG: GIY-YIG nuclease family protein [Prosthecobacter sp.]